jgi:energy-converting hydrogenase Eha subunit B
VDIHLTLHPVMLLSLTAFAVFWCSGLVRALIVFVGTSFTLNGFNTGMVASASVVFLVYLLTILFFNWEANKAVQFISDLFDAYKLD